MACSKFSNDSSDISIIYHNDNKFGDNYDDTRMDWSETVDSRQQGQQSSTTCDTATTHTHTHDLSHGRPTGGSGSCSCSAGGSVGGGAGAGAAAGRKVRQHRVKKPKVVVKPPMKRNKETTTSGKVAKTNPTHIAKPSVSNRQRDRRSHASPATQNVHPRYAGAGAGASDQPDHRLITIIRSGVQPRRMYNMHMDMRVIMSFQHIHQVITKSPTSKIYTRDGQLVTRLDDFYRADGIFFIYNDNYKNAEINFVISDYEKKILSLLRSTHNPEYPIATKKREKRIAASVSQTSMTTACVPISHFLPIDEQLPIELRDRFALSGFLSMGSTASVWKFIDRKTGHARILKTLCKYKIKGNKIVPTRAETELTCLQSIDDHTHVIALLEHWECKDFKYLILEYMDSDLHDVLRNVSWFDERQARQIMRPLAEAMAHLHSIGIVHRDIKPANILVLADDDGNVSHLKLTDFGLSCLASKCRYELCGTTMHIAPEIIERRPYDAKVDVWAAGITLHMLLTGKYPFRGNHRKVSDIYREITTFSLNFEKYDQFQNVGSTVKRALRAMLTLDPEQRISSHELLQHAWLTDNRHA